MKLHIRNQHITIQTLCYPCNKHNCMACLIMQINASGKAMFHKVRLMVGETFPSVLFLFNYSEYYEKKLLNFIFKMSVSDRENNPIETDFNNQIETIIQ